MSALPRNNVPPPTENTALLAQHKIIAPSPSRPSARNSQQQQQQQQQPAASEHVSVPPRPASSTAQWQSSHQQLQAHNLQPSSAALISHSRSASNLSSQAALLAHSSPAASTPAPHASASSVTPLSSSAAAHSSSHHATPPSNSSQSYHSADAAAAPPSDSEWEECVVLRDGKRYPVAEHEKHVTAFALFLIIYFCVTGGPYGLEDGVRAGTAGSEGGVGFVLLLMLLLPLLVHLPIALLTSELASSMPQNGGYILWVSRAFGNFAGFMEGWTSCLSAAADTALYPFLVTAYCRAALCRLGLTASCTEGSLLWLLAHCLVTAAVAVLNLHGWQLSGSPSLLMSIVLLLPFFAISCLGLSHLSFSLSTLSQHFSFPDLSRIQWGLTLSAILWVGSGWDSVGTVGNDVKRPKRTYPLAICLSLLAVTITNVLPMLTVVLLYDRYEEYDAMQAFWAFAGELVGGAALCWAVLLCSVIGNFHLFNVLFTSSSWSLFALFLPGLLDCPPLLRLHGRYATPQWPILLTAAVVMLCGLFSFDSLLQLAMAFNALAQLLQCLALLHLRVVEPNMRRPYRLLLNTPLLALFLSLPMAVSVLLLVTIERFLQFIVAAATIAGIVAYYAARISEREERQRRKLQRQQPQQHKSGAVDAAASASSSPSQADAPIAISAPSFASSSPHEEYDGSLSSSRPPPDDQVNLQAMFEEVGEEAALMTGYRTSAQAEMLPDFVTAPAGGGERDGRERTSSLSGKKETEEDEEEEEEDGEEKGGELLGRRLRFAPISPLRTGRGGGGGRGRIDRRAGGDGGAAAQAEEEDDGSPSGLPSPVLLRSPKDKSGRRTINGV